MILWSSTTSDTGDNTLRNAFEPHPQPTSRQSNFNQQHHHLSQCVLRDTSPFRDQAPLPATAQATSPTTLSNHIRDQAPPETSQRTPCPTPPCHIREVRTPIAKAIWGKKQNKPEFLPFHLRSIDHQHPKTSTFTRATRLKGMNFIHTQTFLHGSMHGFLAKAPNHWTHLHLATNGWILWILSISWAQFLHKFWNLGLHIWIFLRKFPLITCHLQQIRTPTASWFSTGILAGRSGCRKIPCRFTQNTQQIAQLSPRVKQNPSTGEITNLSKKDTFHIEPFLATTHMAWQQILEQHARGASCASESLAVSSANSHRKCRFSEVIHSWRLSHNLIHSCTWSKLNSNLSNRKLYKYNRLHCGFPHVQKLIQWVNATTERRGYRVTTSTTTQNAL